MNKLTKYCQTGGMKTDRAVTFPKLSKLEIDKINQANQKRLFEENQAQLNSKSTSTIQTVKNIGQKIDRDKRINSRQDKSNLLGMALSPIPVIGEVYNAGNTIANTVIDLTQGEYKDALLSGGLYGLSKIPFNKIKNSKQLKIDDYESEINWNKWNKEIPKNKELLKEYYKIEKEAKLNGTWMKDSNGNPLRTPDGSLATPEQFVQLNSNKGKEFLGKDYDSINQVYRGVYSKTAKKNLKPGKAVFTANKDLAKKYATYTRNQIPETLTPDSKYFNFFDNFSDKNDFGGVFNLAHKKSPKSFEFTGNEDNWVNINLNKVKPEGNLSEFQKMKSRFLDRASTNGLAGYIEDNKLDYAKLNNIFDGGIGDVSIINHKKGNYLKSLVGNNGNFDLNNSNVFKSVVPITGASILYNQNKQTGGMNKLLKYCQTGGNGVIAEAGEFYKDENGQIKQINPNTVSHDDYILIDEQGNPISKMPYNQGGVVVNGVQNVLSASHENRESNDKSYKQADEDIRIKPKEGKEFAKRFNFGNIKFNGGSPSKLFDSVLEAKTNKLKKYNNIEYNENSPYGINSSKANGAYVESLPQDEMIYDEIFNYQESKKQEHDESTMQTGGNTLYVESKNDPRYKAYQDSLNAYNRDIAFDKEFANATLNAKTYDELLEKKKVLEKKYPFTSVFPVKKLDLKKAPITATNPIFKYNARDTLFYKKPTQPVKIKTQIERNKINNLDQLQSIPYQQEEVEYTYPNINYTSIQEQEFYNPERVIGSEYNQNSDASYGRFKQRKSEYYDKQLQKMNKQTGGKGTLSPYPEMYGNKPVAMVNIKGKLYPASTVDGRTVSIDDVFNKRDSVELKNFKAIKLNKNERIKK